MSRKFKKDIARSQTLSQISCFSDNFGQSSLQLPSSQRNQQLSSGSGLHSNEERTLGSQLLGSLDENINNTASLQLPPSTAADKLFGLARHNTSSIRMSPVQAKHLCDSLMARLNVNGNNNVTSDYDLDKRQGNSNPNCRKSNGESGIHSEDDNDENDDNSEQEEEEDNKSSENLQKNQKNKSKNQKQNNHATIAAGAAATAARARTRASIFKPKLDGSAIFGDVRLDASSNLGASHSDDLFFRMMHGLKVPGQPNQQQQIGSNFGGASAAGQNPMNCSIVYNSCQLDMSCSVSLRIINEVRRNEQRVTAAAAAAATAVAAQSSLGNLNDDDSQNNTLSTNPSFVNYQANEEKQKEIILDYTHATISRVNYINSKVNVYEGQMFKNKRMQKHARAFIENRLRFIKRLPYVSTSIPSPPSPSSRNSFAVFHSNQPCIVQRHAHFVSKISLDIDSFQTRDICMSTDESFSFVTPLDQHFPNVILVGTSSGKLLLFQLSKEAATQKRRYVLKFSQQIYSKKHSVNTPPRKQSATVIMNENSSHNNKHDIPAEIIEEQVYATCATQVKSLFYIGSSDGTILVYDFKKKSIIKTMNKQIQQLSEERMSEAKKTDSDSLNSAHTLNKSQQQQQQQQQRNETTNARTTMTTMTSNTNSPTSAQFKEPSDSSQPTPNMHEAITTQQSGIVSIQISGSLLMAAFENGTVTVFNTLSESKESEKKWTSNEKKCLKDVQNNCTNENASSNHMDIEEEEEEEEECEDMIIKCAFSPMNENIIVLLTDSELRVVHMPTNTVIFAKTPNVQEYMMFSDFVVNKATQEIVLLSHNALLNLSKLEILSFRMKGLKSHRLRTLDVMSIPYVIHSLLFDKNDSNLFCFTANEIKLWQYYNKQEAISIQTNLLEKFSEIEEILTPTACSPARH